MKIPERPDRTEQCSVETRSPSLCVNEACKALVEGFEEGIKQTTRLREAIEKMAEDNKEVMAVMWYLNSRELHHYLHARKNRVRKKYRNLAIRRSGNMLSFFVFPKNELNITCSPYSV